jgi:proteic killer suppression protein
MQAELHSSEPRLKFSVDMSKKI